MFKSLFVSFITTIMVIAAFLVGMDVFVKPKKPNMGDITKIALTTENQVNLEKEEEASIVSTRAVVGIAAPKNYGNRLTEVFNNSWSVGSGCILNSNGYIVTNQHVVGNEKEEIYVTLPGGDTVKGKVLWGSTDMDLAVIKIAVAGLPEVIMGNSDTLRIGEKAIAIGNPLGFDFQGTLTSGVVSGINRSIEVDGTYMEDLIQTDASINSGNSGGPLMNASGEIIGINTIKVTGAEGIGFAIPINVIKPIINKFIETGEFIEPYLGILGYDRNMTSTFSSDIFIKTGVYVDKVEKNSPASFAGLKKGDVILSVNDKEIKTLCDLRQSLFSSKIGEKIKLKIISNGEENTVFIQVEAKK